MKKQIIAKRKFIETGYEIETFEGELLEDKVKRIVENNEPITDGATLSYTKRADGVRPEYNIRTDKWDVAMETMGKVAQAKKNKIKENMSKGLPEQPKAEQPETES